MPVVSTTFTSDDKEVIKAWQREQREIAKTRSEMERLRGETNSGASASDRFLNSAFKGTGRLVSSFVSLSAAAGVLTSLFNEQEKRLDGLAKKGEAYRDSLKSVGGQSGNILPPSSLNQILLNGTGTRETRKQVFEGITSQGRFGREELAGLTELGAQGSKFGADSKTFGSLVGALAKGMPELDAQGRLDAAASAYEQGIDPQEIAKLLGGGKKLDAQGRMERSKLLKNLGGSSGTFARLSGEYAADPLGRAELAKQTRAQSDERTKYAEEREAAVAAQLAAAADEQTGRMGFGAQAASVLIGRGAGIAGWAAGREDTEAIRARYSAMAADEANAFLTLDSSNRASAAVNEVGKAEYAALYAEQGAMQSSTISRAVEDMSRALSNQPTYQPLKDAERRP